MAKLRKLGDITLDLEPLLSEMAVDHEMQIGEIMAVIHAHLIIHHPGAREEYDAGGHPIYYYGCSEFAPPRAKK